MLDLFSADRQLTEKFTNTIWRSKVYPGKLVRVLRWNRYYGANEQHIYQVMVKPCTVDSVYTYQDLYEFEFMYERLGKCKHSDLSLGKLLGEYEETRNNTTTENS